MTLGPDGNVWAAAGYSLFRLGPGSITGFSIGSGFYSNPTGIASGTDGNLWFAAGTVGRMTPTGIATNVPLDGTYGSSGGIATGSDGNLWMTSGGQLFQLSTAGVQLSRHPFGTSYGSNGQVTAGNGGTIWWTEGSLGAIARFTITAATTALSFHPVTPCRLLDTRGPSGPFGAPSMTSYGLRTFVAIGSCGIPLTARALSVNVTTVTSGLGIGYPFSGDLVLYASDLQTPSLANTISYRSGYDRANNAIVQLSTDGGGAFTVVNRGYIPINLVVDVNGWFE